MSLKKDWAIYMNLQNLQINFELWQDSQKNEKFFWTTQKSCNNIEQKQRNVYYKSLMENHCSIIKDFIETQNLSDKILVDVGSGPQGILHTIVGKEKYALDPLMDEFINMGYPVSDNAVIPINSSIEEYSRNNFADVVFCLNVLDHVKSVPDTIKNVINILKDGGYVLFLTDTRTEKQIDCYHKLSFSHTDILTLLRNYGLIIKDSMTFPHGYGNPVMQFCVLAMKGKYE